MTVPSPEITLISQILHATTENFADVAVADQRSGWEAIGQVHAVPADAIVTSIDVAGVPAEQVLAAGADPSRVVLHLHGGGYVIGSCATHRELAARLSWACGAAVIVADYRLAPEHQFPAAFEDSCHAYGALVSSHGAGSVVLSGDSAGAGLALATAQWARRQDMAMPRTLVCWSPWADLDGVCDLGRAVADAVLSKAWLETCVERYLGQGERDDWRASPLHGSFEGLPPTLVLAASGEVLYGQARRVVESALADGVEAELATYDHDVHLWMLFAPEAPESIAALARAGKFVHTRWDSPLLA